MSASNTIKALLALFGHKQAELIDVLSMGSKQSLSNKFVNERWSADDLVKIASFCGCELAFILPNGQTLPIRDESAISPD